MRLARLDMLDLDAFTLGPGQCAADVFGTVVATNHARLAAPLDDLLQGLDDMH